MAADGWDPQQYNRFRDERSRPFYDLVALLQPAPGCRAIDLGCGTGELTVALHRHLGASETIGIDRSAAMLADQDRWAGEGVRFLQRDIATFPGPDASDASFDVIAANASLQWLGDHPSLLARLRWALARRGQLAFQVPANYDHPSHWVAEAVAGEKPFASALTALPNPGARSVLAPEAYASALYQLGFAEQIVRLQVYGAELASTDEVVEWVKGTLLTPYREQLDPAAFDAFAERYRARLLEEVGDQRPYFYPFKRILCWARLR